MKEKIILAYYCNKPIKNSEIFKNDVKKRFGVTDTFELSNLYVQVVNYQIKKYGLVLYHYSNELKGIENFEKSRAR